MTADTDYPQAILVWLETNDTPLLCHRALRLWNAIHEELSPIVGVSGFIALYSRCIDLCALEHPWLRKAPAGSAPALCFEALAAQLGLRGAPEARVASGALFTRFHQVLQVLIGTPLTDGVLDAAWRDRHAAPAHTPP